MSFMFGMRVNHISISQEETELKWVFGEGTSMLSYTKIYHAYIHPTTRDREKLKLC